MKTNEPEPTGARTPTSAARAGDLQSPSEASGTPKPSPAGQAPDGDCKSPAQPCSGDAPSLPEDPGRGVGEGAHQLISIRATMLCGLVALACFHLAYSFSLLSPLMLGYAWALVELTRAATGQRAFVSGFVVGLGSFAPQMGFLWTIFGISAVPLWCVLAFWIGAFVWLGRLAWQQFGGWALLLLPLLWIGLEYFRSELYFLRFTWLNIGYAFAEWPWWVKTLGGVYGIGAAVMGLAVFHSFCWHESKWRYWRWFFFWPIFFWFASAAVLPLAQGCYGESRRLQVAGVQLEFPAMLDVPPALDRVLERHPYTDLFVLAEYTFDGPVPKRVRDWCRKNGKHLLVGGKEELGDGRYYNTAYVIGPDGEVVFQQAKAVPIQFFKDGLPAPTQKVWNSPWGKLGICICYDSSFTRVTDELLKQGAQALIVPVMDMTDWGAHQHQLHSRIAPVRAAEYRVPVFRVCSSGISQLVASDGRVRASAPFPGQGEIIGGTIGLSAPDQGWSRLPFDRSLAWLGLASVATTLGMALHRRLKRNPPSPNAS